MLRNGYAFRLSARTGELTSSHSSRRGKWAALPLQKAVFRLPGRNANMRQGGHPWQALMKIALFGQFGCGSSGNDGSLEAILLFLRRAAPESELVCFCPNPEAVEAEFGIRAIGTGYSGTQARVLKTLDRLTGRILGRVLGLLHPIGSTRGIDLFIVPGTGFLDDFQERPFGWPFMIFRWSLAARLAGAKVAFVSIGAGPIVHPWSRRFMTMSARMCHYRSYRDLPSRSFMESVGLDTREDRVFPDLAFALPLPKTKPRRERKRITAGVGVMTYAGWMRSHPDGEAIYESYVGKLVDFIIWLLERDCNVRMLTGDSLDESTIREVLRKLEAKAVKLDEGRIAVEPSRTLDQLMRQISETDIMVGTRFHNIICALKMQKPVISLGYAQKNDALLFDAGLDGFSQHVEHFDLELLKRQFLEALARRAEFRERISGSTKRYGMLLAEQERILTDLFFAGEARRQEHADERALRLTAQG